MHRDDAPRTSGSSVTKSVLCQPRQPARRHSRRSTLAVTFFANALCVSSLFIGATPSVIAAATPEYSVGIIRCTFIDPSRGLLNYRRTPYRIISKERTLVTEIRYPTQFAVGASTEIANATPVPKAGGYPTVVFAHGYNVTPDTYAKLLDAWVEAGFVVVAPFFPDEDASAVAAQGGANTEDDLVNEPGDLAFVTKSVLEDSVSLTSSCPVVEGLIDPSDLALAGHSDGAQAVSMLAYDHGLDPQDVNYAQLRSGIEYRAVMIFSGSLDTDQSNADEASQPDLLVIQSLADTCNPFRYDVQLYRTISQSNKWFLELQSAHHLPPFDGSDNAAFKLVAATTISFLQVSFGMSNELTSLRTVASDVPSVGRLFSGSPGPSLDGVPTLKESCGPN